MFVTLHKMKGPHRIEVEIFSTFAKAEFHKQDIAIHSWDSDMPNHIFKPALREEISRAYWEYMERRGDSCSINQKEIDFPAI